MNKKYNVKDGQKIKYKFNYNPKDPRSTFLSMTTKTYPHGKEYQVLEFLPNLEKDIYGNYYKIIGTDRPTVMFTSHLDTADENQSSTNLYSIEDNDESEIIYTDGTTILGADDKAGVTVMIYMMAHNVPGIYYFFIGEEMDNIGSRKLSQNFDEIDYLKNVKKCISFDRKKTYSVVTNQLNRICCSNEFANSICEEYNKNGLNFNLDPTGVCTDSALFMDKIPECTNISVGYYNEHTVNEYQNMTFLEKLCEYSIYVDWENLPVVRKLSMNENIVSRYERILDYKSFINNI